MGPGGEGHLCSTATGRDIWSSAWSVDLKSFIDTPTSKGLARPSLAKDAAEHVGVETLLQHQRAVARVGARGRREEDCLGCARLDLVERPAALRSSVPAIRCHWDPHPSPCSSTTAGPAVEHRRVLRHLKQLGEGLGAHEAGVAQGHAAGLGHLRDGHLLKESLRTTTGDDWIACERRAA